jgi:hypothetical protein
MNDKQLKAQYQHTSTKALEAEYEKWQSYIKVRKGYGVEWAYESNEIRDAERNVMQLHRELSRRAQVGE